MRNTRKTNKNELQTNKTIQLKDTDRTPIEIALQIDDEGMTTASKLYEFLKLETKNFSRWCKLNIIGNKFATENVDYIVFVIQEENLLGGRPKTDYKITSEFAKKLSMTGNTERHEQARQYFIACEQGLKVASKKLQESNVNLADLTNSVINNVLNVIQPTLNSIQTTMQSINYNTQRQQPMKKYSRWKSKINPKLDLLADHLDVSKMTVLRNMYIELEDTYDIDLNEYKEDYCFSVGLDNCSQFDVIDNNEKLRKMFDCLLDDLIMRYDLAYDKGQTIQKRETIFTKALV